MHQTRTPDERLSASARGYDAQWRDTRAAFLAAYPTCQSLHCSRQATLVDHIVPLARGGARLDWSNLQALCIHCHAAKTGRERIGART